MSLISGNTLIICPASLINQWEKEVENRVKRRKLTILLHHGTKRKESAHSICKYDLVISTYGVISSEHKNNVSTNKDWGGFHSISCLSLDLWSLLKFRW